MKNWHTKGPWKVNKANSLQILDTQDMLVADVRGSDYIGIPVAEARVNAQRIAACFNACMGVPLEVLQAQAAGGLPWSVADQLDQRAKHDQLRQEFEAFKEGSDESFAAVVEQKQAALARVKQLEQTIGTCQQVIATMRSQLSAGAGDPTNDAIQALARDLPEGWECTLTIERHAGTVHLTAPDGQEYPVEAEDRDIASQLREALRQAVEADLDAENLDQGAAQ